MKGDPEALRRAAALAAVDEGQAAEALRKLAALVNDTASRDGLNPADVERLARVALPLHERLAARAKTLEHLADVASRPSMFPKGG